MNGVWRAAVAALLGHALTAPGVDASARIIAALVLVGLCAAWSPRAFVAIVGCAGAMGGGVLQDRVLVATQWEAVERVHARLEVVELRRNSVRARLATTDLAPVSAWVTGLDGARPGQIWDVDLELSPIVATRNPDDRDGVRSGLAAGAVLHGRVAGDPRLVREGRTSWARHVRDAAHAGWQRRWGEGAGLWSALLLADRRGLHDDAQLRLQLQGLAHLLALSGLHVGILAGVLILPWRGAGPWAWVAAVPVLVIWTLLAGAGASMVRAVGMVAWIAVARVRGIGGRPLDALAAVVVFETLLRPEVVCGVGWWLSYTATAAILRVLPWSSGRPWWAIALIVSCAAQAATAAWTLDAFGRIPWAAPVVQLVIGPAFTVLLAVGGVGAVIALGTGPVAAAAAGACAVLAHGFGLLVGLSSASGRLAVQHPGWDGWAWAFAVGLSVLGLLPLRWTPRARGWAGGLAALVVVVAHVPLFVERPHRWVSLDVGQGDAGVYHCRRRVLVIDAGPYARGMLPAARVVAPYLARRGVRDATLVLTHGHLDHIAGTGVLLETGRFGVLAMAAADSAQDWARELALDAAEREVALRWLAVGDTLWSDCCEAICLWPTTPSAYEHANDRSVVMRLGPRDAPLLATGDLERRAETEVLALLAEQHADGSPRWSLKVAHHGGNTGTDEAWLRRLAPRHALISCGRGNRYGHPHPELIQRLDACGAELARTDLEGALELRWTVAGEAPVLARHGRRPTPAARVDSPWRRIYAAVPARSP